MGLYPKNRAMFIHDELFDKVGDQVVMNVLIYLVRTADENGNVYDSYTDIGKAVGYTKSVVYRCVQKLLLLNALKVLTSINKNDCETVEKRSKNGRKTINERFSGKSNVINVCNIAAYRGVNTLTSINKNDCKTVGKRSENGRKTIELPKTEENVKKTEDIKYFEDDMMNEAINKWLKYKKEKRQTYKPMGIAMLKTRLLRLSNNDGDAMMKIVDQSIANNYVGLFDLRDDEPKEKRKQPVGVVLHDSSDKDYTKGLW